VEENINLSKFSIVKNSEEETSFIKDVLSIIKNLDVSNLSNINKLKDIVNTFALYTECTWGKNFKLVNIIRHSKSWWNEKCNQSLRNYRASRNLEDRKIFNTALHHQVDINIFDKIIDKSLSL